MRGKECGIHIIVSVEEISVKYLMLWFSKQPCTNDEGNEILFIFGMYIDAPSKAIN